MLERLEETERERGKKRMWSYLMLKKYKTYRNQNKLPLYVLISPLADDLLPVDHHFVSA